MNRLFKAAVTLFLLAVPLSRASAQVSVAASMFDKGRMRATISGGWGQAFNQDYFVLGAGVGYYLFRGLELGVDGEAWIGDDPQFQKLTPEVKYVFKPLASIYPYVGTFYRRIFYDNLKDTDSWGGRAGGYVPIGQRAYVGGGVVVERQVDCDQSIYEHCTTTYPEFVLGFVF